MNSLAYEDKSGQPELFRKQHVAGNSDSDDSSDSDQEFLSQPGSSKTSSCWDDLKKTTNKKTKCALKKREDEDVNDEDIYVDLGTGDEINTQVRRVADIDELMQSSVITPEFNRLHAVPKASQNKKTAAKLRKTEREKTTGSKWFNMPAPEMTDELKRELQVVKMRSVFDPKQFYKKNTMTTLPKYFQMGRIVESKAEYYSSRIPNKERKKTMVDELVDDAKFQAYNKKRFTDIIMNQRDTSYKAIKHSKRLKNRKR